MPANDIDPTTMMPKQPTATDTVDPQYIANRLEDEAEEDRLGLERGTLRGSTEELAFLPPPPEQRQRPTPPGHLTPNLKTKLRQRIAGALANGAPRDMMAQELTRLGLPLDLLPSEEGGES